MLRKKEMLKRLLYTFTAKKIMDGLQRNVQSRFCKNLIQIIYPDLSKTSSITPQLSG